MGAQILKKLMIQHKINPAFSRILQRLRKSMTEAWNTYAVQEFSPSERATHLLTVAVEELKKKPLPYEQSTGLFPHIRYVVFNYVPWKHFNSRTTVSYFNFTPTIIQKEPFHNTNIVNMIRGIEKESIENPTHKVILENEDVANVNGAEFQAAWTKRWYEYLSIGASNMSKADCFSSWNEFLMNHASYPENMGVIWNLKGLDALVISGDYVVDETFLNIDSNEIYKLELKKFLLSYTNKINEKSITQVAEIRGWCVPSKNIPENCWKSDTAIERALISLYWGFGIWGASSLISIPVTHASSYQGPTGVLSIGSTYPLSTEELYKWSLIADCVLGTLLNLEAEARIIRSTTQYVYRVGHTLKNRSNSIARFAENITKDFKRLLVKHEAQMSENSKPGLRQHIADLRVLGRISNKMSGFGSLVNFLSALSIEDNVWSDKRRAKRWLTEAPVAICDLIAEIAEDSFHGENTELKINLKFSSGLDQLYFVCQVNNNSPASYLGRELLSAIFFELTVNAIHHGMIEVNEVVLMVSYNTIHPHKGLTLTNKVDLNHVRSDLGFDTVEYSIDGAGGETLAGHLLSELIVGAPKLKRRIFKENDNYYFQYVIDLPVKNKNEMRHESA